MLTLVRDLIAHKGFANAVLLDAVRRNSAAAEDAELLQLLEHIRVANRFWLLTILDQPFDFAREGRASASLDELIARFEQMQREEEAWLASATDDDLARVLEGPLIPNGRCSVAEALLQVTLHSHGHRAQCAKLLRRAGGEPPMTDFIMWIARRPAAPWPDPAAT